MDYLDYFFPAIGVIVVLFLCVCAVRWPRMQRILRDHFQSIGGKIVARGWYSDPAKRRVDLSLNDYLYEATDGSIRYHVFRIRRGQVIVEDDVPLERRMAEEYGSGGNETSDRINFNALLRAADKRLPESGYLLSLIRAMRDRDGGRFEISERDATPSLGGVEPEPFARLCQRLRIMSEVDDRVNEATLELMIEGEPVNLHWQLAGETGDRQLLLSSTAGAPLARTAASPGEPGG